MQFTTPLLIALLAPSVALAFDCTQFRAVYRSTTENPGGFTENTNRFYRWAARNGGECNGWCNKVKKKKENVYEMVCWAPRLNKVTTGIPHAADGTEIVQTLERGCDAHCTLGDGQRACGFTWQCCHGYEAACFF